MNSRLVIPEQELRQRRNAKWSHYSDDVLPAWIAEMDYRVAEPIQAIINRIALEQDYGYPERGGGKPDELLSHTFATRMKQLYGWQPAPEAIQFISAIDQAILTALLAFTEPGDGIIVQTPCYPPFYDVMKAAGRHFIKNPMIRGGDRYEIDFEHLRKISGKGAKVLLLCNPQNPTGRVFDRSELQAIAEIAIRHDLLVICDEIHSDLVYAPDRHTPLAALGPEIAARTITLNSASKGFNLPGLYCGVMCFGDTRLAARCHAKMPRRLMGQPNTFGLDATIAAWTQGADWAKAALAMLAARRGQLIEHVRMHLPDLGVFQPQGTYLAWLDLTALDLKEPASQFLLREGKVAAMPGEWFDSKAEGFVRINFATSEPILTEILERIISAVRSRG
ncbi:MalY/PatB family protein [Phyllobacterium myrsinacearum]|uniref:cysteine-S-conjugate beta-lyase n=1 Tax=Phyllobacterium myrsinacearum TaxID=28101 RepID=A0A839EGV2_9HYPH|nr:aminotransferase class I/II-fold pyridoxal phosphate-dependent enzyme [Phyllobacterium myrsinacearum]MBA8877608.1 cystathionine beta-lyase [Phyllobacterium myrsinacearum]